MAKKELPKAQLAGIVKGIVKGYQGAKAGVKLASQIKTRAKNIKAIGVTKKAEAVAEAEKKAARLQKAADTRAANAKAANAAKNSKTGTPKPDTKKPGTTKTETPKGKEPFVKSKARLATENVTGKVIGGFPFYTMNAVGKVLKNPIAQGIIGGGTSLYVANRYAKTNAPKKVKKYKKK
jgi:hypothetical protein